MNRWPSVWQALSLLVVLLCAGLALGDTTSEPEACQKLPSTMRSDAAALLGRLHPYDCCDGTIAQCLKKKPCSLVKRLATDVCTRVGKGEDAARIERALNRRGAVALPTATQYTIQLNGVDFAGEPASPVTVVAYVCPRCPFCAKLIPALHHEVTEGRLKGKIRLGVKMFPLRTHKDSVPGALAEISAARLGKAWPFLLGLYEQFDHYDAAKLAEFGATKGLSVDRMRQLIGDSGVRAELVESKKEGVRNGVEATPALFIDGRRYEGELDAEDAVDVLGEAYERKMGQLCR